MWVDGSCNCFLQLRQEDQAAMRQKRGRRGSSNDLPRRDSRVCFPGALPLEWTISLYLIDGSSFDSHKAYLKQPKLREAQAVLTSNKHTEGHIILCGTYWICFISYLHPNFPATRKSNTTNNNIQ